MLLDIPANVTFHGDIADFTPTVIADADMGLAQEFFASIYTQRRDAVLREVAANAADANEAAGNGQPVHVTLPTLADPRLVIADSGTGMSLRDLTEVYCGYLKSLKREDPRQRGGYGVGAKTPCAVADFFTVVSIKDQMRHELIFAKLPTGGTGYKIISSEPTNSPSGTTVTVPIADMTAAEAGLWQGAANRTYYWWEPNTVFVDNTPQRSFREDVARTTALVSTRAVAVLEVEAPSSTLIVRINGVGYGVPAHLTPSGLVARSGASLVFVLEGDDAPLVIARNRESIEDTDATGTWVEATIKQWLDDAREAFDQGTCDHATALQLVNYALVLPAATRTVLDYVIDRDLPTVVSNRAFPTVFTSSLTVYPRNNRVWKWRTPRRWSDTPALLSELGLTSYSGVNTRVHNFLNSMLDGLFITEAEFKKLSKAGFARWRRDENTRTLTVVPKGHLDLTTMFTEAEISWTTAEKLAAEFPKPERKVNPILFQQYLWNTRGSLIYGQPQSPEDLLTSIKDDQLVIAGTDAEFKSTSHLPKGQVLLSRGPRSTTRIAEILGREVLTFDQGIQRLIDGELQEMTPKQRRFTIEIMALDWVRYAQTHHPAQLASLHGLSDQARRAFAPVAPIVDAQEKTWLPSRLLMANPKKVLASKRAPAAKLPAKYPLTIQLLRFDYTAELINALVSADEQA